jgi:hypothetical protein
LTVYNEKFDVHTGVTFLILGRKFKGDKEYECTNDTGPLDKG